jgi:hypothetical protein
MPRTIQYSDNRHIEYRPGNSNLILLVAHGGRLRPKTIPNRDFGAIIDGKVVFDHSYAKNPAIAVRTKSDLYTVELALAIADVFRNLTGLYPHVVICHLHRSKLDCNRSLAEATFGVPEAVAAWTAYHEFVRLAKRTISGSGLLIDIHGHSHPERWIEIGYALSAEQLNTEQYSASDTSIYTLYRRQQSKERSLCLKQLICGPLSFGGLIETIAGFDIVSVPSPQHPCPRSGCYFSGGYSITRHGSIDGGTIDAIQIESPLDLRLPDARVNYSNILGQAISMFMSIYYS